MFHKYIAFYAYINCCKTNSSLKRGNEKVAISNINTIISNDIQKVWNIVLAVDKYNSWRSDLSKTEIINDKQFIEYTKNGYATTFTVTVAEPYKLILSILVYTLFSRMFDLMQPPAVKHSIAVV